MKSSWRENKRMILVVLVCSLALSTMGQQEDDGLLDPNDRQDYNPRTKTMERPAEEQSHEELTSCKVALQRQIEEQPACNPVFEQFLRRLLKEIKRVGEPSDSTEIYYDAKMKLSIQAMMELQSFVDGKDRWRTGALDSVLSQILVDLKPHNYKGWERWLEETIGVEVDTVWKIGPLVLIVSSIICIISTIICTQLWSTVSWFVQFRRLFVICFFVSIIWNWFYLYKIAFAEHQNNIKKMDSVNEKCTGVREISWIDSLKEWFRTTWTLQDDPCKKYYEVLVTNPILLVSPLRAVVFTITILITEPLELFGQGTSKFLRALLKDLPVTLHIPVLITTILASLVIMYVSIPAAFQHGIMAPFRRPRRDPPLPETSYQSQGSTNRC